MAPGAEPGGPLRIGVFGGTFDPPHNGHLSVARDVADALGLDRLLWIPARTPPHKGDGGVSPAAMRLEMVRATTEADARFHASELELVRPGPSYTVDTLRALHLLYPGARLFLVLGADQVRTLEYGWKAPQEILGLATLALLDRDGEAAMDVAPALRGMEEAVHVDVSRIDVSSTRIRAAVAAGEDVSAWVPAGVMAVIRREGLYRCAASSSG